MAILPIPVEEVAPPAMKGLDLMEKPADHSLDVQNASILVLEPNKDRGFAVFTNDSDTVIYLRLGQEAAVNTGIRLNALGGLYEINRTNMFKGLVYAISAGGAVNKRLCCQEIANRYPV